MATRPVHGRVRWALQPGTLPGHEHPGVLVISSTDHTGRLRHTSYLVSPITDSGGLVGYRLTKRDGTTYDLPHDLSGCSCPDNTWHPERPGGCRHMAALRAALAALEGRAAA